MNEEQEFVVGSQRSRREVESCLRSTNRGVLLSGSPRRGGKVSEALDGDVGNTRQNSGQVVADRSLDAAAGLHDGQNRRHLGPGLLAANMDPVLPAQRDRTDRVLRQVGTQFQHRVFQEAGELLPLQKSVVRRLPQRTGRQRGVAGCFDCSTDDGLALSRRRKWRAS